MTPEVFAELFDLYECGCGRLIPTDRELCQSCQEDEEIWYAETHCAGCGEELRDCECKKEEE